MAQSNAAAVELSTPPDMATATRTVGICGRLTGVSIRLAIDALDEHGAGVGRFDGRAVHVRGALPGEEVRAHIEHTSPHHAEAWARLLGVDHRSPGRVEPPCPHAGDCGGCALMHLSYEGQLRAKAERVRRALPGPAIDPVVGAQSPLHYRGTAKYVVVRRQGRAVLGSYAPGTHRVADMSGCLAARPPIPEVAAEIARLCDETRATPRYVLIRADESAVRVALVAWTTEPRLATLARRLRQRRVDVGSVSLNLNPSPGNALLGAEEVALDGEPWSPRPFHQGNPAQAGRLYEDLVGAAALRGGETVLDLYSGAGAIAEALAAACPRSRITAVDRVAAEPRGARFVCADVAEFLAGVSAADLAVVNPPRKGLGEAVSRALCRLRSARLFYVSCMPETLQHDLHRLGSVYTVTRIRPYDLLPQTAHVEVLAEMAAR
jgi:23S rRNA (uracil1939-C5)-methyltransferase